MGIHEFGIDIGYPDKDPLCRFLYIGRSVDHIRVQQVKVQRDGLEDVDFSDLHFHLMEDVVLGVIEVFEEKRLDAELGRRERGDDVRVLNGSIFFLRKFGALDSVSVESGIAVRCSFFNGSAINCDMHHAIVMARIESAFVFCDTFNQIPERLNSQRAFVFGMRIFNRHTQNIDSRPNRAEI